MRAQCRARALCALLVVMSLGACREPDRPLGPGDTFSLAVDSDPQGAAILVDDRSTGLSTPDTVPGIELTTHRVSVRKDSAGITYGFSVTISPAAADSLASLRVPLLVRCGLSSTSGFSCGDNLARFHAPHGIRFAAHPAGPLLYRDGRSAGLTWPATSSDRYASVATPAFAALVDGQPVALGIYSHDYLAGRPAPLARSEAGVFTLEQSAWILPARTGIRTARGIEMRTQIVAVPELPDALGVRLVFANITDRETYRVADPGAPAGGITYENAFVGLMLDADVGGSGDDLVSYAPELNLAFAYDADLREAAFAAAARDRPGMIGLRVLEAPPGAGVVLNAWPSAQDWFSGYVSDGVTESSGHGWMAGTLPSDASNHPLAQIGNVSATPQDYRLSAAVGPLRLAPGDSAAVVLALAIAAPAAGSYAPGTVLPPGDPADPERPLARVAAPLLALARAADALLDYVGRR